MSGVIFGHYTQETGATSFQWIEAKNDGNILLPYPIKISSIDGGKTNSIKEALNIIVNQIKNGYNPSPIYKQIDVFFQEGGTTKQK